MTTKNKISLVGLISLCLLSFTSFGSKNNSLDLTYPYNKSTIYWPTEKGFHFKPIFSGITPKGYFYSAFKFCAPEHGGTHIDAPKHFSKKGYSVDQIPLAQLMGPAVVIHVEDNVKHNPDYSISVEDIKKFEKQYRALTSQDIVLFYTGYGKYWHHKKKYMGSDKLGDVKNLHFPGLSKEAAQYLVDRNIKGLGIDTASMDPGNSTEFWTHRIVLGANIYGLENVAHLQALPPVGSELIVAPMKIEGGSGAPTRIYARF